MRRTALLISLLLILTGLFAGPSVAQDDSAITPVPVELAEFGITSVVPEGWGSPTPGFFTRGQPPADVAAIAIQAQPVPNDVYWPQLLPTLGLDEVPTVTGERSTDFGTWALYRLPVSFAGIELEVEVALAEVDGGSYLVLLQASPDEFDDLRDAVLLPAIDAYRPADTDVHAADGEEVSFAGADADVELSGTLTLPDGPGPHPAVVLLTGSGPQDRDSTFTGLSALRPFADIAAALTDAGVAVLRYDDRGVGDSTGVHADAVLQDFAADGAAAIDFLAGRDDIDADRIGVLGHSEGGAYTAILGVTDPRVAFIVALAAPTLPGVEQLIEQSVAVVEAGGADDGEVARARAFAEVVMPLARDGDADGVEAAIREGFGAEWDDATEEEQQALGDRDTYVQRQVDVLLPGFLTDSYRALLAYDAPADWSRVVVPVLAIFGGLDVQVPAESGAAAISEALEVAGNDDVTVEVLPQANHLFQDAVTGAVTEYSELEPELTPELLPLITGWVAERVAAKDDDVADAAAADDVTAAGEATEPVVLVPFDDELFGVSTLVPDGWPTPSAGTHTRRAIPDDPTVVIRRSVPLPIDELWPRLLPELGLEEIPDQSGSLSNGELDWARHAFSEDLPSGGELAAEVALAEVDGTTILFIFQSGAEVAEAYEAEVILPILDATVPLAPEATPDPATLGYTIEEVRFAGGADEIELAGTLTIPSGDGPHPGVVLMSGSGLQDRDEALPGIATLRPFALIADALSEAGVAVLRYDDRGTGESTGESELVTVSEAARDGEAALRYLRDRPELDPSRVGLLGHSEGGIYAMDISADDPDVAFIVLMAAPTVDGVSLLQEQTVALARAGGEPQENIDALAAYAEVAIPAARDGDEAALREAGRELFGSLWDLQSEDIQAQLGEREAFIEARLEPQVPVLLSEWYRSILAYEPREDLVRVEAPILALFGALDMQVVTSQNAPAFEAAVADSGNPDATVVILPDANHLFQAAETGAFAEYGLLADEFTADFLPTLVDWVTERVGVGG